MRINFKAHAGFCGACGPCSCNPSRGSTAVDRIGRTKPNVECWWTKLNHSKHRKSSSSLKKGRETNNIVEESDGDDK